MELHNIGYLISSLVGPLIVTLIAWRHYSKSLYLPSQKYLTFWPRFFASYADSVVLWPLNNFIPFALSKPLPVPFGLILLLVFSTFWYIYSIFLHAKYGQTVGKMVCQVRVVDFKTEGKIGIRQALLRDSFPILISIPLYSYQTHLILSGKSNLSNLFNPETILQSGNLHLSLLFWIPMFWGLAEIITMLTNKKRRALHDFIAGTVVVRTKIQQD